MKITRILPMFSFALALVGPVGAAPSPQEVITLPDIEFPLQLLHRGVTTGEVHLMLKISPDARLLDALVTAYTHKAFADATLAALPQSILRPITVDGQPVITMTKLVVRFEARGMLVIERHAAEDLDLQPGSFAYQPCAPDRLDEPLQVVAAPSPGYPDDLRHQGVQGHVVLEYYIDESGRVRMPTVQQTENQTLAGLSLLAVEQWQFNPPSSRGRPVLVRVRQKFVFAPGPKG